jgi:hypothetical protein
VARALFQDAPPGRRIVSGWISAFGSATALVPTHPVVSPRITLFALEPLRHTRHREHRRIQPRRQILPSERGRAPLRRASPALNRPRYSYWSCCFEGNRENSRASALLPQIASCTWPRHSLLMPARRLSRTGGIQPNRAYAESVRRHALCVSLSSSPTIAGPVLPARHVPDVQPQHATI